MLSHPDDPLPQDVLGHLGDLGQGRDFDHFQGHPEDRFQGHQEEDSFLDQYQEDVDHGQEEGPLSGADLSVLGTGHHQEVVLHLEDPGQGQNQKEDFLQKDFLQKDHPKDLP